VDFSVIIPTRNRPAYLQEAIDSVIAQRGVSFEIIIVDDGDVVLPRFNDPRVRVFNNQQRGPVPARNLGVAHAMGDMIAFLDDDDWWTRQNFLEHSLSSLKAGCGFTFADGTLVFMNGGSDVPFAFDADSVSLETNNSILISSVCYARNLHDRLGRFDEALPYYWDWDWYLRVARSGAILKRLAESMVAIRVHAGNMSSAEQEKARRENLNRLSQKHGLGKIVLKNHLSLAFENA
jgi:glycosyltransferase involved in cell wall biosynthesis